MLPPWKVSRKFAISMTSLAVGASRTATYLGLSAISPPIVLRRSHRLRLVESDARAIRTVLEQGLGVFETHGRDDRIAGRRSISPRERASAAARDLERIRE